MIIIDINNKEREVEEVFISKVIKNTIKEKVLEVIDPKNIKKVITLTKHR